MKGTLAAAVLLAGALGTAALAQHDHRAMHQQDASATSTLSAETIQQLLNGDGMGLAKAAELNGYPGPKHVLELENALNISAEQKTRVEAIRQQMLDAARPLGRSIVDAERELDAAFSSGRITTDDLAQRTSRIAELQGKLRNAHLQAHLLTRDVMTKEQIAKYAELRRLHH